MATTLAERHAAARALSEPRRRRPSSAPVIFIILLTSATAAGAVAYMVLQVGTARRHLATSRDQTSEAKGKVFAAERRAQEAEALLDRERQALGSELEGVRHKLVVAETKAKEDGVLADKLEAAVSKSEGALKRDGDRLTLELVDRVLFSSAKADLTLQGIEVLRKVGKILAQFKDKQVWVQGHTDGVPITTDEFPSNWELSSARALNVVHFLEMDSKIPARRLAAVGFGSYRPISKKRAKNRRIEIVLFPEKVTIVND